MTPFNPYLCLYNNWKEHNDHERESTFQDLLSSLSWVFAHAIPNEDSIDVIRKHTPIVEMFAGSGYWASVLISEGCDIEAFDDFSFFREKVRYSNKEYCRCPNSFFWTKIEEGTPSVLSNKKYDKYTLMLCWPPDDGDGKDAADCLKYYGGKTLIYIGQEEGGCTAGKKFFEMIDKEWDLDEELALPSWPKYESSLFLYNKII